IAGNIEFVHLWDMFGWQWGIPGPLKDIRLDAYGSYIHIPPNHNVVRFFLFLGTQFVGVSYGTSECPSALLFASWRQIQSKFNVLQTKLVNTARDRGFEEYHDSFELNMTKLFYLAWKRDETEHPCAEKLTLVRR